MSSATQDAVNTLQGVPEILTLEKKEEDRVDKALASYAEKEAVAQRTYQEEARTEIAKEEAAAEAEITEFGTTELQKIIAHGEDERATRLAAIEASFKKNSAAVTSALAERMTDPSFLAQAA